MSSEVTSSSAVHDLEIRLLGQFGILVNGAQAKLPPSKKTRSLLAYLVLENNPVGREKLCDLFWDIPDDPRGSLRWSLSKLRALLNKEHRTVLYSDRQSVWVDTSSVNVDALDLVNLMDRQIAATSNEYLIRLASRYRGHLLEGLELPKLRNYNLWCIAQRERVLQRQCRLLRTIRARFSDDPIHALPHARSLVSLAAYEESDRAELIQILVKLHRYDEADEQLRIGQRMLDELGQTTTGALVNARRGRLLTDSEELSVSVQQTANRYSQFFGRDAELESLLAAYNRVCHNNQAEFCALFGEPGIGKSALLDAFAHAIEETNATIMRAAGFEAEPLRPFGLWQDIFPDEFVHLNLIHRNRLFDALASSIAERSAARPLVLLFDDIQWSDDSSLAALHYVARIHQMRPLLVIMAARLDDAQEHSCIQSGIQKLIRGLRRISCYQELRLSRLRNETIKEIIANCSADAEFESISNACQGIPLLAVELARANADGSDNQNLQNMLRDRMASLSVEGNELLQWAAVACQRINSGLLANLSGLDQTIVGENLSHAERLLLLQVTSNGYRFCHDLVARSIYDDISPARRRVMHARVAGALERNLGSNEIWDLVHHAAQSGSALLAAKSMLAAARICLRFFANDDAASLATEADHLLLQLPAHQTCRLAIEVAEIRYASQPLTNWQIAADQYVRLAEHALDHGALAHARKGYQMASHVRWSHGHWTGAREQILQAERVSRAAGAAEQVIGMAEAARCLAMAERDLNYARSLLFEAQSLAKRHGIVHPSLSAACGILEFHEGRLTEATDAFRDARMLCRSSGDRIDEFQTNEYLFMIAYVDAQQAQYESHAARILELGGKIRAGSEGPFAECIHELVNHTSGKDITELCACIHALRRVDAKHRLSYILNRLAALELTANPERSMHFAKEANFCARTLDRFSERLYSNVLIAQAFKAMHQSENVHRILADIDSGLVQQSAAWARQKYNLFLTELQSTGQL